MRLNKYLAKSGIASRRKSDDLIRQATTEINGQICLNPAYFVKPNDKVLYDGKKIRPVDEKITIMLNKPKNVITTMQDDFGRKTVMDLLKIKTRIAPVGRLDKNTTGLLLLTNDGKLHQYLTHPRNGVIKSYEAVIEGRIDYRGVDKIKKGIYIGYNEYGKAEIVKQDTRKGRSKVVLRLKQGKKREIRRIFFRLGKKLISLNRIGYSNLSLGNLRQGEYRYLQNKEIRLLKHRKI